MRPIPPLAAALLLSGCYSYAPAEPATLRPQDEVRVHLTREGMIDLPEILGSPGPTVGGRLVSAEGDRLLLRVPVSVQVEGYATQSLPQEVPIAASQVVQVERRRLDRFRTGLAVAGILVGGGALVSGFGVGGPPEAEQPQKPTDEEAGQRWIAVFRIPFRFP